MGSMIDNFKVIALVMLFYSFSMTMLVYVMPESSKQYLGGFSEREHLYNMNETSQLVGNAMTRQQQIPVLEVGTLVFYSGNIVIDLLFNFIYAVPEMLGLLIAGLQFFIVLPENLVATTVLFISVCWTVLYLIGLLQLLTGIRSGQGII